MSSVVCTDTALGSSSSESEVGGPVDEEDTGTRGGDPHPPLDSNFSTSGKGVPLVLPLTLTHGPWWSSLYE